MSTAEDNRKRMPWVASIVDEFRKHFGQDVKVLYAKENGIEVGTLPDPSKYVVPNVYIEPEKPTKRRR